MPTRLHNLPAPTRLQNLPAPHAHLFGREQDSATVQDLVLHVPGRLVTLTGTGGCGKTQLALQVAAGLVDLEQRKPTGVDTRRHGGRTARCPGLRCSGCRVLP
jgi:ABC-type taurine transport system ATPase subunit